MEMNRRCLKLELPDGSIEEMEYEYPIDRYDLLRLIYHQFKYDQMYDWNFFYDLTYFIRKDNGIETSFPVDHRSCNEHLIYQLILPQQFQSSLLDRLKHWLWSN